MNNSRCRSLCNFWILSAVTLFGFCQVMPSHGQALSIYNVTGAGGAGTWDTAGNWIPAVIPDGAGSIVSITSNIGAASTLNLSAPHTVGMLFIGDQNNTHAFSITGSTLTFDNTLYGNAFLSKVQASNQVDVISADINLLSNLDINVNPGGAGAELNLSGTISGAFGINTMGGGRVRLSGTTSNTYTGLTTVYMRGFGDSANPNLVLAKTGGAIAVSGNLKIGNVSQGGAGSAVVQYSTTGGTSGEQIWDGAVMTFDASSGNNAFYKMMGYEETVRGVVDYTREGVIEVVQDESLTHHAGMGADTNSTLTLATQAGDQFYYNGYMRNRSGGSSTAVLNVAVTGTGKQTLAGDRINYTGTTTIGAGAKLVLENAQNFNSSSVINNGTLEFKLTNGARTFSKEISGNGAFSKIGPDSLTLNSTGAGGGTLLFSSMYVNGGSNFFTKNTNVGAGGVVIDGTMVNTSVILSSTAVFNVSGDVSVTGARAIGGTISVPTLFVDSASNFTGAINIQGAYLQLDPVNPSVTFPIGVSATLGSPTSINISDSGALYLGAIHTASQDRIGDTTDINLNGGNFYFWTQYGDGAGNKTETVDVLSLTGGSNFISTFQAEATFNNTLTFSSLSRTAGATVRFTDELLGNALDKVVFTAAPTLDAGGLIGGWAVIRGVGSAGQMEFATYDGSSVIANAVHNTGAQTGWLSADNVKITGAGQTLTASRTINSLNFQDGTGGRTLALGANTLTINSGGIISSGSGHSITGTVLTGRLTAGAASGYELDVYTNSSLTIGAVIANNGANAVSVVKSGGSTLVLSGVNTYTGKTIINEGTIQIAAETGLGAAPALAGDNLVLNNGTLRASASMTIDDVGRNVLIRAGDGTFSVGTGQTLTIANTVTSTEGGRLLFNILSGSSDGTVTLTGANNNLSGGLESAGNTTLAGGFIMNGTGTGTIGLIRLFGGTIDIRGTNTLNNDISMVGGKLFLRGTNTFSPGVDHTVLLNGGELVLDSVSALAGSYALSISTGTYNLNGRSTAVTSLSGGTSALITNESTDLGLHSVLTINQNSDTTYSGLLRDDAFVDGFNVTSGPTLSLVKNGSGMLTLTNDGSSYVGSTTINAGVLNVTGLDYGQSGSAIGSSSYAPANLVINGGTLRFTGNAALGGQTGFTDRSFTLGLGASAGAIIADGVGIGSVLQFIPTQPSNVSASYTGTLPVALMGSGSRTLTLGGANRGNNRLDLILRDSGGPTSINKIGNGAWSLNPYIYTKQGNVAFGSFDITGIDASKFAVGQWLYDPASWGYATGTYITAVDIAGNKITLNNAMTGFGSYSGFNIPFLGSSYSGETVIKAGTLATVQNGSFGSGKVIVGGGAGGLVSPGVYNATLELRGVDFTGLGGTTQSLIMNGGTLKAMPWGSNNNSSWAGSVTYAANSILSVTTGAQLTLSGTQSGTGSISQYGDGTVVLSGAIDAGRNGSVTSTTASYSIQSGKLVLDYTIAGNRLSDFATLSLGGGRLGAILELKNGSTVEVVSGVTLNSGDNIIRQIGGTSILRMNAITRNSGSTVDFSADSIASTTTNNDASGILGAWATVGGLSWATKSSDLESGSNYFIKAYTLYTASLVNNDWAGSTANMDALFTGTGLNIQSLKTANSLRFNAPSVSTEEMRVTLGGANTITSGGILVTTNMGTDAAVIAGNLTGSLTTTATDWLILQNNPSAPLVISVPLQGATGLQKLGVGNLILSGLNTYTGVTTLNAGTTTIKTLTDVNSASGIGTASASGGTASLVFNGGTLQFNGAAGLTTSNRGYTVNNLAIWDVGNVNTTLKLTGQYATSTAEGDFAVKKIGAGTLELSGTLTGGSYGLNNWDVSDGTVRLITGNTSDKFARNLDATLTMSGGTLEIVGGGASNDADRAQNFKGRLNILEGSSKIIVRSLAGNAQPATLNLQDSSDPQPIRFGKGSSLLLTEDPTSGNTARITIAGQVGVDVQVVIPRVVYSRVGASQYPGVNYFAVIDQTTYSVIPSDNDEFGTGQASHTIASDLTTDWNSSLLNVTDGATVSQGYTNSLGSNTTINTIRFFNNQDPDSIVTIGGGFRLTIGQGAILQTTHSGNTYKAITGGELTSNLTNEDDASVDLLIHNWNPLRALEISSAIVNNNLASGKILNFLQTGNGTTALSGTNTYTGNTYVQGGVLRIDAAAALPAASHLRLDGGVLGLNYGGNFTRSLGTGSANIDWTGSGGFASYGGNWTVNLGGGGATVVWGAGSFVPDNDTFILGAYHATGMLIFANGLDLGRKDRMIRVDDGTAEFDGQLTGIVKGATGGILTKTGQGGLQLTNTNTYVGGTQLAQGLLHGTVNSSFGDATGAISIGNTADTNAVDALELRYGGSTLANAITVGSTTLGNTQSISTIRTTADVGLSGVISLQKDTFLAPASTRTSTFTNVAGISGPGRITLIDGGTLQFNTANTYGSGVGVATTNSAMVNGGTIIRSGIIRAGNGGSLGTGTIELGDATYVKTAASYATTRTVLGVERTINDNANGLSALGGEFVALGNGTRDGGNFPVAGNGAFYNISKTIDGYEFQASDVIAGTRILVKDETENPERNGIYKVVQLNADGTMNIARVTDFDETAEMLYGSQITVTSGSSAGKTYFMASPDIATVNGIGTDPSQWMQDMQVNPSVTLYATAASLTIANAMDVNANGSGTTTIGTNSNLTGVSFTGNVTLQNVKGSSVAESKTLTLESASNSAIAGVTFGGIYSEADGTGGTPDVLSLSKTGLGVATLSGANTFHGTTNVQAGTLRITSSNALGAADGLAATGTTVVNGANLEIDGAGAGLTVGNELLTLSGTGVSSSGAVFVRNGTDNTWGGGVTLAANSTVNVNTAAKLTFSNTVQGGFALDKTGAGTLVLSGSNTYSGNTNVTAGTLLVNNTSGSGTGSGAVNVSNSGTTLGGGGSIVAGANNVTLGSGTILSIGNTGSLVAEDLNITTTTGVINFSGQIAFDLYKNSAGVGDATENDRLLLTTGVGNAPIYGVASTLAVNSAAAFIVDGTNYAVGSTWDLIDWTLLAPTGTFSNITAPTGNFAGIVNLSSLGREWDFTNLYTTGQISVVAIVPEPGRFALLAMALAGFILRRRRKL